MESFAFSVNDDRTLTLWLAQIRWGLVKRAVLPIHTTIDTTVLLEGSIVRIVGVRDVEHIAVAIGALCWRSSGCSGLTTDTPVGHAK
jgi:hypothetical protein